MKNIVFLVVIALMFSCSSDNKLTEKKCNLNKYSVPELADITIDGKADEWRDKGLKVKLFADSYGNTPEKNEFAADVKLAWNINGLAVLIDVRDDSIMEDHTKSPLSNDNIELFICNTNGGKDLVQIIISPGINSLPNIQKWDHRGNRETLKTDLSIEYKSIETDLGYQMEVLLPLEQVGVVAKENNEISFQVYVNDIDNKKNASLQWHFLNHSYRFDRSNQQLVLSKTSSPEIDFTTRTMLIDFDSINFKIFTDEKYNGQNITIKSAGEKIYETTISSTIEDVTLPISLINTEKAIAGIYIENELKELVNTDILYRKYITENQAEYPLEQSVRMIKHKRKTSPAPKDGIMFIGHSQIRFWRCLEDDMEGLPVYNHGFGGSQTTHVLQWADDLVFPYAPKIIVYFEGANDISVGRTPEAAADNTEKFVNMVHEKLPDTKILILEYPVELLIKRTKEKRDAALKIDSLHAIIADKYDFAEQISLYKVFTDENGETIPNLVHPDNTHLNQNAYSYLRIPIKKRLEELMD